jgi:hypothetical protein
VRVWHVQFVVKDMFVGCIFHTFVKCKQSPTKSQLRNLITEYDLPYKDELIVLEINEIMVQDLLTLK